MEAWMNVGVRELRDTLSRQLAEVRAGHVVTVTDHGRPIARIVPAGRLTRLEELRAQGKISPAATHRQPLADPIAIDGTVSDLIADQRR